MPAQRQDTDVLSLEQKGEDVYRDNGLLIKCNAIKPKYTIS
jgi:hypothetical protein